MKFFVLIRHVHHLETRCVNSVNCFYLLSKQSQTEGQIEEKKGGLVTIPYATRVASVLRSGGCEDGKLITKELQGHVQTDDYDRY